jgi:hypothetical protein
MVIREAPLVFVRLAHDRRFIGAFLFVFFVLFVLFIFFRISGRHRVAHDHEGTPPGGKFFGDVWGHVVAPLAPTGGEHARVSFALLAPLKPQHEKSTALPRTCLNVTTTKASGLDSSRHRAAGSRELPPVKRAPKLLIVKYSEALAWNFRGLVSFGIQLVRSLSAPAHFRAS